MISQTQEVRSAVKRDEASQYVLIMLVSFALSVILTRLFLHLTGYPMIANDTLHIAHVLWGGLLLFIATLLPLVYANRWALTNCAILSGIGVGLFIDEVGKFITMNNDYHFPAAAPIIYVFFLLTVAYYMRVRNRPETSPRSQMYHILEEITEVLDSDLDEEERSRLEQRLLLVSTQTDDANLKRLAQNLYDFLEKEQVKVVPQRPTRTQRVLRRVSDVFYKIVTQPRMRWFLVLALAFLGVISLYQFVRLLIGLPDLSQALLTLLTPLAARGEVIGAQEALWFVVRTVLQGAIGMLLVIAGGMIVIGRERTGIRVATISLILSLAVINVLVFYLEQFSAVTATLVQFFVLLALTYYRSMYLKIR
jgi:hypothetical protein